MTLSVLMCLFKNDSAKHFSLAMDSLWCKQSLKPTQIVLVLDGPLSDELYAEVKLWGEQLVDVIKLIELPENRGLGAALNIGLRHCSNEYVARMDADDIAYPDRFLTQIKFLTENTDIDIVGSYATEVDWNGSTGALRKMPLLHKNIVENLWACPFIHPSVMFRTAKIIAVGNYEPTLRRRQDYELWFRCAYAGLKFANIGQPLLYYRFNQYSHKKQPLALAWEQAKIGYTGSSKLEMPFWKRFACFVPFFRALLPSKI